MRKWLTLWVWVLAVPALAQQTGSINGMVVSEDGRPLPGATLTIESPALQGRRDTVSGEEGRFVFALLPPGVYSITTGMSGMNPVQTTGIPVTVGQPIQPRITLKVAPVAETIVVSAQSVPELDTTAVVKSFDSGFLESL